MTTAQTHLTDLTKEIAAAARDEIEARNNLATAIAEQEVREKASNELGSCPEGQSPDTDAVANAANADWVSGLECTGTATADGAAATGARAVYLAAKDTKANVDAQQAFHDARAEWAADAFTPIDLIKTGLDDRLAEVNKQLATAGERLLAAKNACKVRAFDDA